MVTESDVDSEKVNTTNNETTTKKLAIRQPFDSAPKYHYNHPPLLTTEPSTNHSPVSKTTST